MSQYDGQNEILNSAFSFDTDAEDYTKDYKFNNVEDTEQLFLDSTYIGKTSHERSFDILNLSIFNIDSDEKAQTFNDIDKKASKPISKKTLPISNHPNDGCLQINRKNQKKIQQDTQINEKVNQPSYLIGSNSQFAYGYTTNYAPTMQFNIPYRTPLLSSPIPVVQSHQKIYHLPYSTNQYQYGLIGPVSKTNYQLGNLNRQAPLTQESFNIIQYFQELYLNGCLIDYLTAPTQNKYLLRICTNMNEDTSNFLCDALLSIEYGLTTCMLNCYSSQAICLMISKISSERRFNLLASIQDKFELLASDTNGSLSILCLIKSLSKRKENEFFISMILRSLKSLSLSINSWSFIVKVLKVVEAENKEKLNFGIISILQLLLSTNHYGTSVVSKPLFIFQAIALLQENPNLKEPIANHLVLFLSEVIAIPYSIDFFIYFIENSSKKERKPITEIIIEISHLLATNKWSLKVVLALGEKGSSIEQKKLLKNLFSAENVNNLLSNQLGNFCLNYLAPKCSEKVLKEVISLLEKIEGMEKALLILLDAYNKKRKTI